MASIHNGTRSQDTSLCLNTGVKDAIKAQVRPVWRSISWHNATLILHLDSGLCYRGLFSLDSLLPTRCKTQGEVKGPLRPVHYRNTAGGRKKETWVFEFEGTEEKRTLSRGEAEPPSTTRAKQTEGLEAEEGWHKDGEIISLFFFLNNS